MSIAVFGGTGLVGRYVVQALVDAGLGPVVATCRERPSFSVPQTKWVQCDLRQPAAAALALEAADSAVICAGQVSTSAVLRHDPTTSVLDTLRIVTNILEAAAKARVRRVVLISSCTVYPPSSRPLVESDAMEGNPPGQWFGVGWMHRYTEQQLYWHAHHLGAIGAAVALRPTLIYGRYDDFSPKSGHFVPSLVAKVVNRQRPIEIWGSGEQSRNLIHASDVAGAVLSVLRAELAGVNAFNVVSPSDTTVNDVLQNLLEIDGYLDAEVVRDLGAGPGPKSLVVAGGALKAATGWEPRIGLREGLRDVVSWYRQSLGC